MKTVIVTGANRGIGLALVDAYLSRNWRVIATCRRPDAATELAARRAGGALEIERLDVGQALDVEAFADRMEGRAVDMLINNAGVYQRTASLLPFDPAQWAQTLNTNALGALHLTARLLGPLRAGRTRKIVSMSSALGSIDRSTGGANAYRSSKAALNMGMNTLAQELVDEGFTVVLISPGIVDTDLARDVPLAKISPRESAETMADLIDTLGPERTGAFLRHTGEILPW